MGSKAPERPTAAEMAATPVLPPPPPPFRVTKLTADVCLLPEFAKVLRDNGEFNRMLLANGSALARKVAYLEEQRLMAFAAPMIGEGI